MDRNTTRVYERFRPRAGSDLPIACGFFICVRCNYGCWPDQLIYDIGRFGRTRCKGVADIHD